MNGRIYDPLLGRFLSADLGVQFPGDLQSYNRYSYVRNNPLSTTDPSGFDEKLTPEQQAAKEKARKEQEKKDADSAAEAAKAAAKEAARQAQRHAEERSILGPTTKDRLDDAGVRDGSDKGKVDRKKAPDNARDVGASAGGGSVDADSSHGSEQWKNWIFRGSKNDISRLKHAYGQVKFGKNKRNPDLPLKSSEDLGSIEASGVPVTVTFNKRLGYAGLTTYTLGAEGQVVGVKIEIDPNRADTVVSLAHELWHANIGIKSGKPAADAVATGWYHLDAYAREYEVADAYDYPIERMVDDRPEPVPWEIVLKYIVR
jgi:hypothetical protein